MADEPGYVSIGPADAEARGIEEEQLVWVRSRRGKVLARAAVDERVNDGAVYMTYQWWIGKCNELTLHVTDGESGTPEDKYSACEVERIPDQRWAEDYLVERYAELKASLAAEADRQNPPAEESAEGAAPSAIQNECGEAAGAEGTPLKPADAAPAPIPAFAPHEAEVAGRALYANGDEETLV